MDKLLPTTIQPIYEYDPTYKIKVDDKVLKQLSAHCFIYRCSECFKMEQLFLLLCNMRNLSRNDFNDVIQLRF